MRRFDKLKVIKEANQSLEDKFLSTKLNIFEQPEDDSTKSGESEDTANPNLPDEKKKGSNPIEDFNLFKKDLGISGDDSEASGTIRGGSGKQITINSKGEYTISDDDDDELQTGTFKSMGIWPNKHIELKPSNEKNYFKIKNILSNLDNKVSSQPITLYNTLSKLVKNNKNLTDEGGYYSYAFFTNKNGVTVSVHLYPESGGSGGEFKMSWRRKNPVPGKSSEGAPALWVGKFKKGGEVFTTKDTVVSIDKNGKIDSGLITILSKFWPDYKG